MRHPGLKETDGDFAVGCAWGLLFAIPCWILIGFIVYGLWELIK